MSYSLILQNEIRNRGLGERKRGREGGKGRKKKKIEGNISYIWTQAVYHQTEKYWNSDMMENVMIEVRNTRDECAD